MDLSLDAEQVRVLGSLLEKEVTTPEYYPLSLNALLNACNQKSNRDPVVHFDEQTVERALYTLRDTGLLLNVTGAGSRVPKFGHRLSEKLNLGRRELANISWSSCCAAHKPWVSCARAPSVCIASMISRKWNRCSIACRSW